MDGLLQYGSDEDEEVVAEAGTQQRRPLSDEERAEIKSLVEAAQGLLQRYDGVLQRYDAVLASEAASCACLPPCPPCEPRECILGGEEEERVRVQSRYCNFRQ